MICEFCSKEHDGNFGSGRFCNASCSANFSRKLIALRGNISDTRLMKKDSTRKKFLLKKRSHRCECCGITEWLGHPVPLELDHIDGNSDNNDEMNLRIVCPNCHAFSEHRGGKNARNRYAAEHWFDARANLGNGIG